MKRLLLCSLLLMLVFSCKNTRSEHITVVTAEEMQAILALEEVQLIAVRRAEECIEGHIRAAQNINFYSDTVDEDILKLDKSKPVILYCKSGRRSAACSEKLVQAGLVKGYALKGGITQWKHEELEL